MSRPIARRSSPRRCVLSLLLAGASLSATAAHAAAEAEAPRELQEVVVTADRGFGAETVQVGAFRNARVIDTPLTVNVVSKEVLEAQGALTLYDALRNTAGVTRSQLNGATYDNISIRGILVENRGNYRLNGALPIVNLVDHPLENKARVEVLKGASALYYGFVPPSGVINLTTERAEADPNAGVSLSGDDHGSVVAAVDLGRQWDDGRFGARVNLVSGHLDTGIDRAQGDRYLAAVALDFDPTERLSFALDYERIGKDIAEPAAIALLPAVNGVIALPAVPDPTQNLAGGWQTYDAWAENVLLRTDLKLSDRWAAKLEIGQAKTERDRFYSQFQGYNLATGAGTLQIGLTQDQLFTNRNARAELTGLIQTGPIEHEVTFGATGNERRSEGATSPNRTVAQNLYAPVNVARPVFATPTRLTPSQITDLGVYVFDRMTWGPVQVLAGLRWSDYESVSARTYQAREVTPAVAVVYKLRPNVSLYATYLEGLEEGGIAPANNLNAFEVLAPAKSSQWEIGAKAELGAGVVASVAYFEITRPSAFTNSENRFVLDGETDYRGVEFMAAGDLTERLSVIASGVWLDASLERAADTRLIGKRPENTPEWTASLFADYRLPMVEGLAVNAGVFYVGERAVNNLNQAFVDGYATVSLGVRLEREIAGRETSFQVNVENALDETYWNTAGNGLLGVGAPRTVKFTVARAL